jgi:hypothetical protein
MQDENNLTGTVKSRCRLLGVAPGVPTTNLPRTVEHYARLGFTVTFMTDGFAILERNRFELHLAVKPQHDPKTTATWIYIRLEDADAFYEELKAAGIEGLREPHNTDYRMREVPSIDPDGNLLLFGSRMKLNEPADPSLGGLANYSCDLKLSRLRTRSLGFPLPCW